MSVPLPVATIWIRARPEAQEGAAEALWRLALMQHSTVWANAMSWRFTQAPAHIRH
jgi:hypothetical protein